MSGWKKLASAAAATGGGLNVENVFSTYLYKGNGTGQTITNGIDLSTEGGMVWMKNRSPAGDHNVYNTVRGRSVALRTNQNSAEYSVPSGYGLTSFNTDGFTLGTAYNAENTNNDDLVSWTFRKAPKFFDVVTYTGNDTNGRTISHNLGADVGMIIIKDLNYSQDWQVWHKDLSTGYMLKLNLTNAEQGYNESVLGNGTSFIAPTSTEFTVGESINYGLSTYVAYLFAHNNGDGEFGPTGDQDIIKCGSVTTNSSGQATVNLGFEPQWVLVKRSSGTQDWRLFDSMRGMTYGRGSLNIDDPMLRPNLSNAELASASFIDPEPDGFYMEDMSTNSDYIYIAIRRGPMAVPESATDVFAMDTFGGTSPNPPEFVSGFPVDLGVYKVTNTTGDWVATPRLTQGKRLRFNRTSIEDNETSAQFDYMNGYYDGTSVLSQYQGWMWRRAPNFFDVVAYTGNGSTTQTLNHNLGAVPEMIWIKNRTGSPLNNNWHVYHKDRSQDAWGWYLNLANAEQGTQQISGTPTDTQMIVENAYTANTSGANYIAYLFASLDGISKVGSFTGTGANGLNIDCGFSSGARFVLIKNANRSSQWYVWDTERGIVAGNDPWLALDTAYAQQTSNDYIDPYSAGFTVNYGAADYMNTSGDTHIFYAIA